MSKNMKSLPNCQSSYQTLPKELRGKRNRNEMKIMSNDIKKKKNCNADSNFITTRITGKKEEINLIKYTAIKLGKKNVKL